MELIFKFIIDKVHSKKNFALPVRLRLYHQRDYKEHSLGFALLKGDWNEQLRQVLPSNENHLTTTKTFITENKDSKIFAVQ